MVFIISLNIFTSMDVDLEINSIDAIEPAMGIHSALMEMKAELKAEAAPVRTIEQFTGQLLHMLHALENAQAKHEAINKNMMAQCSNENSFRKTEILNARNSYNAAQSSLSKCQASLHAAKENLPSLQKAKADYEHELAVKQKERDHQHALYVQRAKDWADATAFLDEFSKVMNQKLAKYPTSLADLSEKLLRHTSKLGIVTEAVPILVALTQDPSEFGSVPTAHSNFTYVPQGKIAGNLRKQISNLRNRLVADSHQNDLNEQNAQKLFDKFKANMVRLISVLTNDINRTKQQITLMTNCVANETAVLTKAASKIARNDALMKAAQHTCSDFTKEFVAATKNRLEEINTVNTIIKICAKRFGELPKELISYLKEIKNKFRAYVNSSVFHKYVKYVQKHVADNAEGKKLSERVVKAPKRPPTVQRKRA